MIKKISFIDIFAGIGGFHIALANSGMRCIAACEWDKNARKTYESYFRSKNPSTFEKGRFFGDIKDVNYSNLPNFDILVAGFPCQPFSLAGKKLGFDETRGTLFYEILEILQVKKPVAYLLENVPNIENHDNGRTIKTIEQRLRGLGYSFWPEKLKASDFGLPSLRKRLFMVGFKYDPENKKIFRFPKPKKFKTQTLSEFFGETWSRDLAYTLRVGGVDSGFKDKRNWDTYKINGKVRKISVDEAKKLMGFPNDFKFPVSDGIAMKQLGNSVAIPVVEAVAKEILKNIRKYYPNG
jgi:DNA (cytosine-5)-methyltransferase 1